MDIFIIEPIVRPSKKKNRRPYRDNVGRHKSYRIGKRGPHRGLVQALYEGKKNGKR